MEVPSVRSWVLMPGGGFRLHLRCPIGVTPSDFEHNAEALAGALGGSSIQVKRNPRHAGDVYLTLVGEDDPLYGEAKPPTELLAQAGGHSPMDGVPIGYNSVGETVRLNLYQNSFLIGGSPGSGKSVLMQQVAAFCALAEHCELWCIDPKLVELQTFWADSAHRMATDVESATALLDDLIEVMNARYAKLQSQRLQKVFDEGEGRLPTADVPLIVLIVDEVAELTASLDKKKGAEFAERLRLLVSKSRASGCVICLCTQKPDISVIPSSIRDLCSITICLRTGTEAQAITVMGAAAVKEGGAKAQLIGTDTPGLAYLAGDEGGTVTRFRSFYIDREGMETLTERATAYRLEPATSSKANPPALDELTTQPADLPEFAPASILPPKAEDPATFAPRDWLADTTPPQVVFGCDEHRGLEGAHALQTAEGCPSCMLLPRGEDGD
jgi:S-DNA-T family DNA segregation ATPase FtsK/SpoIIIE